MICTCKCLNEVYDTVVTHHRRVGPPVPQIRAGITAYPRLWWDGLPSVATCAKVGVSGVESCGNQRLVRTELKLRFVDPIEGGQQRLPSDKQVVDDERDSCTENYEQRSEEPSILESLVHCDFGRVIVGIGGREVHGARICADAMHVDDFENSLRAVGNDVSSVDAVRSRDECSQFSRDGSGLSEVDVTLAELAPRYRGCVHDDLCWGNRG